MPRQPPWFGLAVQDSGYGLRGVIRKATYLGSHIEYSVETPIGELFVIDGGVVQPIPRESDVLVTLSHQGVTLIRS